MEGWNKYIRITHHFLWLPWVGTDWLRALIQVQYHYFKWGFSLLNASPPPKKKVGRLAWGQQDLSHIVNKFKSKDWVRSSALFVSSHWWAQPWMSGQCSKSISFLSFLLTFVSFPRAAAVFCLLTPVGNWLAHKVSFFVMGQHCTMELNYEGNQLWDLLIPRNGRLWPGSHVLSDSTGM